MSLVVVPHVCSSLGRQEQQFDCFTLQAFTSTMDSQALDALVYPTFVNSPTLLGDGFSPTGEKSFRDP